MFRSLDDLEPDPFCHPQHFLDCLFILLLLITPTQIHTFLHIQCIKLPPTSHERREHWPNTINPLPHHIWHRRFPCLLPCLPPPVLLVVPLPHSWLGKP